MSSHRLPDGSIPVLLSSDTADGLRAEAVALLAYLDMHPAVTPDRVADMLFRTRVARRHRALAMVSVRAELLEALRAIASGETHPAVVAGDGPATSRKVGFVFPGQGSQRPGMGQLYYQLSESYRARVDECAAIHEERFGHNQPLHYLLGNEGQFEDEVWEVQPALMFHMTGLAAMWRAAGVDPAATIGHSQGELAAGAVSEVMSLRDAVLVVTHRSHLVQRMSPRGYSMAVLAMHREDCEALLARHSGWAELSVVNSPHIMAISGDRSTIKDMVVSATSRGQFAREIAVAYPAHTSIVAEVREAFEGFLGSELDDDNFSATEIPCYGATLGDRITPDLAQEEYWYWNLRNRVRFDRAVVSAAVAGIDTLIEVVEHPVLQLALQENLTLVPRDPARGARDFKVLGTSLRTATSLYEFTRNLATVAVQDLNYRWDALRTGDEVSLPLRDFPHTVTNPRKLWAAAGYDEDKIRPAVPPVPAPQRLVESWTPWDRRSLTPLRTIALVDPSGRCGELSEALVRAADRYGATATVVPSDLSSAAAEFDTVVIVLPAVTETGSAAAIAELTAFFAERAWLPAVSGLRPGGECWLVTVGGEAVVPSDPTPQLFHAAAASGFRSVGIEFPGVLFRHLDLPADSGAEQASRIVGALHTSGEPELALRGGKVLVKRLLADESEPGAAADLDHVVIVGGTGQLGLLFGAHFARSGAGRVTLLSRSGESGAAAGELARLRAISGTEIVAVACDVNDPAAVSRFAAQISGRPVSLLIHAAVNYVDAEIADITADMVATAAASKVSGLDAVLAAVPLTARARIVLCSSLAATIGGRGQILYAVTNRMLDVLARQLRERGLDATSLEWSLWSVAGPLDTAGFDRVAGAGVYPMNPAQAIAAGFSAQPTDAVIISADWPFLREILGAFGQAAVLSQVPEQPAPVVAQAPAPVVAAPVAQAEPVVPVIATPVAADDRSLTDQVLAELERVMGVAAGETIDRSVPLVALGLDSLQALDFRKRVRSALDRDLPVAAILGGASLDDVVLLMAQNTN